MLHMLMPEYLSLCHHHMLLLHISNTAREKMEKRERKGRKFES